MIQYVHIHKLITLHIDLDNSCLTKEERKEVMEMLCKYKEAFNLRDEIGTCPNIEVEIDVTDKSPFCIRPYHVKEEDKALIMDDLLFTSSKGAHMTKLEDFLKALLKNGLKISQKKCQLYRTKLHYMGNEIFIQNNRVFVKPLRSILEQFRYYSPPPYQKDVEALQEWLIF